MSIQNSSGPEETVVETALSVCPHLREGPQCLKATATDGDIRWLWIDALCINQEDNAATSIQVQIVIIWLRRAEASSSSVVQQRPELASMIVRL